MIGRLLTFVLVVSGVATVSQGPQVAQQYEQRLGGAIGELEVVVAEFDADVAENNLTREQALATYQRSPEQFLKDRGNSMQVVIERLEDLKWQKQALTYQTGLTQPMFVAQNADQRVLNGVFDDFEPAVSLTTEGGIYGLAGGILGWLLAVIARATGRTIRRPGRVVGGSYSDFGDGGD